MNFFCKPSFIIDWNFYIKSSPSISSSSSLSNFSDFGDWFQSKKNLEITKNFSSIIIFLLLKFLLYIPIKRMSPLIIITRRTTFMNINFYIRILIWHSITSLMLRRRNDTKIMMWSVKRWINILIIMVSILISVKTLLELLKLPSHFINFKSMNVSFEFLHMTSTNIHGCKSKALMPAWYRDGMNVAK